MGVPLVAPGLGADERFLPRVQPLVRLELAALGKRSAAVGEVTPVRLFARVGSHVSLQRLLAREDAVADVALDAAGRRRALADQRRDCVKPGPAATLSVPVRSRRRVRRRGPGLACGRAGARALEIGGHRHFVPVPREVSLVPDRGAARGHGRHHSGARRQR